VVVYVSLGVLVQVTPRLSNYVAAVHSLGDDYPSQGNIKDSQVRCCSPVW